MAATSEYGVDNPPQPLNGVDRESFHTAKNFSGSESTSSYYTAAETPSSSSLELSPPLANEAEAETEPTIKDDINELRGRVEAIERQLQQAQKVKADKGKRTPRMKARTPRKRKQLSPNAPRPSRRLLHKACSQQVLVWLTKEVKEWKFIARLLGLEDNEISRIVCDHPQDTREQCYQMFVLWKSRFPENYTYSVLGNALKKENKEIYCKYENEVFQVENDPDLSVRK